MSQKLQQAQAVRWVFLIVCAGGPAQQRRLAGAGLAATAAFPALRAGVPAAVAVPHNDRVVEQTGANAHPAAVAGPRVAAAAPENASTGCPAGAAVQQTGANAQLLLS